MIVFLDTCILIDFLKENKETQDIVEKKIKIENCAINDIIAMELLQGARNKSDLRFIQNQLNRFQTLEINQIIMDLSKELIVDFSLSHNAKIPDAIIAASCIVFSIPLFTYNYKDFEYIKEISLYIKK